MIPRQVEETVYLVQRSLKSNSGNDHSDQEQQKDHKYKYSESKSMQYKGCSDGFYNQDGTCSIIYNTIEDALLNCDFDRLCQGVAEQGGKFVTVSEVFEDGVAVDYVKANVNNTKNGNVVSKLNRIIEKLLDDRTQNAMLVEPWTSDFDGDLISCHEDGESCAIFDSQFEAQFYCEDLGDGCVGVSEENGKFIPMQEVSQTSISSKSSIIKAPWCSETVPPMSIDLPSINRKANHVMILWPVVNLKQLFVLMGKSSDDVLANTWNNKPLKKTEYDRYALDITIKADTVIIDDHFTVFNVRKLDVIARKLIITKKLDRNIVLTFRQVDALPVWWPIMTAPLPDKDPHGIDGLNGADGYTGTDITFDLGCINGEEKSLEIEVFGGKGSVGQNGSDGKNGEDGRVEKDQYNMKPRYVYCDLTESCKSCCYGKGTGWKIKGKDCSLPGSSGGNAGNGGNSGRPGEPGSIQFTFGKGFNQNAVSIPGPVSEPGSAAIPGKGGQDGKGGCGEQVSSCWGTDIFTHTRCESESVCHGDLMGADCEPNHDGELGVNGERTVTTTKAVINSTSSAKHLISANSVHQDFLLKYAVMLMNQDTIDESQEVLHFITRFNSATSRTAKSLLSIMSKDGQIDVDRKPVSRLTFPKLQSRLNRRINRGKRLENALNKLGELFDFTFMFYEMVDIMLEIVEEELYDIQEDLYEANNDVARSYESLQIMQHGLEMTHLDLYDDLDLLVNFINLQINALQKAADRQKRCSVVGSVMSFIPGVGKGVRGAAAKGAEAAMYAEISSKLGELECENLTILDFLTEFVYKFALLGEDVIRLRTPEDFKTFEASALKEFFSGDLLEILSSEDFYVDTSCLLGLVEVPNNPPNFGLMPSLDNMFPSAKYGKAIDAITGMSQALATCSKADDKGKCYVNNCSKIIKGINYLVDTGLDCKLLSMDQLDEWIKTIDDYKNKLTNILGGVQNAFEELKHILGQVQGLVDEIVYFIGTLENLLNLDIFSNENFSNIGELFLGNNSKLSTSNIIFSNFL